MIKQIIKRFQNHYIAKCNYIKYYNNLELDEKTILLEGSQGKTWGGNMYYLAKELASNPLYYDFKIYFAINKDKMKGAAGFYKSKGLDKVEFIEILSKRYFQIIAQAKYLITDTGFLPFFIKKEGQIYLNTWHGTPLKKLGKSVNNNFHDIGNIQRNFIFADYLLFPNQYTLDHMVEDYMLENLSHAKILVEGYPRNTAFFDDELSKEIKNKYQLDGKQVIAYMPTWREGGKKAAIINKLNLEYIFEEFENQLKDNQVLYVNLHPFDAMNIDFEKYKRIKPFPETYETYEFLSIAEVLVTDYSSVFFDFLNTNRKVILYVYDKIHYTSTRGLYRDLENFPFPIVETMEDLIREINKEKKYEDTEVRNEFCPYDSGESAAKICKYILRGRTGEIHEEIIPNNNKENVFIFAGRLANNGITSSLKNLIKTIDLTKRNYYLVFHSRAVRKNKELLKELSEYVNYFPFKGKMNLTLLQKIYMFLYKNKIIKTHRYKKLLSNAYRNELKRMFATARIDSIIHFTGYDYKTINLFGEMQGNRVIYVHANMVDEIKTKGKQRFDVLSEAYRTYDKVAIVSKDIKPPTYEISNCNDNIVVCRNIIDYKTILRRSMDKFEIEESMTVYPNTFSFMNLVNSDRLKFINIGRFSPEKGQMRLLDAFRKVHEEYPHSSLVIMGGYSYGSYYQDIINYIHQLDLADSVVLLRNVANPYTILKKMDALVLSSYAEGFGLVIAEANILDKPVISVDIQGAHSFMLEHGGTLYSNDVDGLYEGMCDYINGKVGQMTVDYEKYNKEAIMEFESLFNNLTT